MEQDKIDFSLGAFPQPEGKGNGYYIMENGKKVELSLELGKNDSKMKLCNIVPSQKSGFDPKYFAKETGLDFELQDSILEYDFVFFNINDNCEKSETFEEFYEKVKVFLVKNNVRTTYSDGNVSN